MALPYKALLAVGASYVAKGTANTESHEPGVGGRARTERFESL